MNSIKLQFFARSSIVIPYTFETLVIRCVFLVIIWEWNTNICIRWNNRLRIWIFVYLSIICNCILYYKTSNMHFPSITSNGSIFQEISLYFRSPTFSSLFQVLDDNDRHQNRWTRSSLSKSNCSVRHRI